MNFTSLIDIVDALGGVEVESEYAFTTSEDSGLVMDVVQGMNSFNGKTSHGVLQRTPECAGRR